MDIQWPYAAFWGFGDGGLHPGLQAPPNPSELCDLGRSPVRPVSLSIEHIGFLKGSNGVKDLKVHGKQEARQKGILLYT